MIGGSLTASGDSLDPTGAGSSGARPIPRREAARAVLPVVVRNLLLESDLRRILEAFAGESVDVLVLKGIPLALRLFGAVDSRAMVDNDLLVRRHDAPIALRILERLGYRSIDCRTLANQLGVDYQYRLSRTLPAGGDVHAELHWNIAPRELFPISEDVLWQHAEADDVGFADRVLVFDRPLTTVHLALHFALSDFAVPSVLVDVAAAWNRWYAAGDPEPVLTVAARTGLLHVLDFALLTAADRGLLDGEPPPIRSPRARRLRRLLPATALAGPRPEHDYARQLAAATLADPWRIPAWLWRAVFPPAENLAVIERLPVSRALYLRYLTRPFRIALRAARSLAGADPSEDGGRR